MMNQCLFDGSVESSADSSTAGGGSAGGMFSSGSISSGIGYLDLYLVSLSKIVVTALPTIASTTKKYAPKANTAAITTPVVARTVFHGGHVTRFISSCSSST